MHPPRRGTGTGRAGYRGLSGCLTRHVCGSGDHGWHVTAAGVPAESSTRPCHAQHRGSGPGPPLRHPALCQRDQGGWRGGPLVSVHTWGCTCVLPQPPGSGSACKDTRPWGLCRWQCPLSSTLAPLAAPSGPPEPPQQTTTAPREDLGERVRAGPGCSLRDPVPLSCHGSPTPHRSRNRVYFQLRSVSHFMI